MSGRTQNIGFTSCKLVLKIKPPPERQGHHKAPRPSLHSLELRSRASMNEGFCVCSPQPEWVSLHLSQVPLLLPLLLVCRKNKVTCNLKKAQGSFGSCCGMWATWGPGLRPLNQSKWVLAHSGHWYHLANQLPVCLRQPWAPYLSSDKSMQTHGSFEPREPQAGVQEHTHYHVCVQEEGPWHIQVPHTSQG